MRKAAIALATGLCATLYRLCRILGTRQRIVCISRQSNEAPVDFLMTQEWFRNEEPSWNVVVLAKALNNPLAYIPEVCRQIYYIATSRAVVLDSYCIAVGLLNRRIKAPVIQIWHALGNMKRFGYTALDSDEGRPSSIAHLMHMHEGYDAVAISSLAFARDFAAGFNVPEAVLFEAPLPRADHLVDERYRLEQRTRILEAYPQLQGKRTIVYCPTFRRGPERPQREALAALADAVDLTRYNLVYKPHPVSCVEADDPRITTLSDPSLDALYLADAVVSDYSTIIYEAGLMGLPVYLYAYDWDTYHDRRGLYVDLEHDVPTVFSRDARTIFQAIDEGSFDEESFARFTAENIAMPKGQSATEHLCRHILELIDASPEGRSRTAR